jgi:hypothetical protein
MRATLICFFMATSLAMLPGLGNATGCLKGAAVGGVVGHVAGHHALLGAAAGCVIEHHREKEKDKAAVQQKTESQHSAPAAGPATTIPGL